MLVPLTNTPRDYAWGSTSLLADLERRTPTGAHEAEIWFGDHPGDPSETPDGRTLDTWLASEGAAAGAPVHLPYLLKLLAAASSLSIQAHPSKAQAEAGFAREQAAGVPIDATERVYRDANHKPELIVAVSDTFRALAGLRDLDATRRLVAGLGEGASALAERLEGRDAALDAVVEWVLAPGSRDEVRAVIEAAVAASSEEFAGELALVRELDAAYPGDPGIVVALLMNLVVLRRGEGLFVPAGVLHAYQDGLGVELMAASDNVLRGGLTPKHVDVAELMSVLDATPGPAPVLLPTPVAAGLDRYEVPVTDFALSAAHPAEGAPVRVPVDGVAIAVATAGETTVAAGAASVVLSPGQAVLVTPDESEVVVSGRGDVFVAQPGVVQGAAPKP